MIVRRIVYSCKLVLLLEHNLGSYHCHLMFLLPYYISMEHILNFLYQQWSLLDKRHMTFYQLRTFVYSYTLVLVLGCNLGIDHCHQAVGF